MTTVAARDGTGIAAREESDMGLKTGLTVENAMIAENEAIGGNETTGGNAMIEEGKSTGILDGDDDTAGHRDVRAVLRMRYNAPDNLYLRRTKRSRQSLMEKAKGQSHQWKNRSLTLGIRGGWQQRAIQLM